MHPAAPKLLSPVVLAGCVRIGEFALIAGIGMIPALVTPKARALHDFAAGTREVTDPPRGTMRTWA